MQWVLDVGGWFANLPTMLATSWLAMMLTGVGGAALLLVGSFGGMLGLVRPPWSVLARWTGKLALCAFFFIAGWRAAADSAAQNAKIKRLESENTRLSDQLAGQRLVADAAAQARDELRAVKVLLDGKVADYEKWIREHPPQAGTDACLIDDADLRFRRSLRQKPAARR